MVLVPTSAAVGTLAEAAATVGRLRTFSTSSLVRVLAERAANGPSPCASEFPGLMVSRLDPTPVSLPVIASCTPLPRDVSRMTAKTPMTIPSMLRALRPRLTISPERLIPTIRNIFPITPPPMARRRRSARRGAPLLFVSARRPPRREHALEAAPLEFEVGGRRLQTWGYDGGVPGSEVRVTEGDTLRVKLLNRLPADTTIHWHGLPVPNAMDGVPHVTQTPVKSGEGFTYDFVVPTSGTYVYHSHVGLQLDRGLYGPLIVEPKKEELDYDREYVLLLDDWLDGISGTPEDTLDMLQNRGGSMGRGMMGGMGSGMMGGGRGQKGP